MAYNRTQWIDKKPPYIDAAHLNNMEDGITNGSDGVDYLKPIVADNTNKITALSTGEDLKGTWTPASGAEYPQNPQKGDSWYIGGLTNTYTFTAGDLTGKAANNQDKIVYSGTAWSLIEKLQLPDEVVLRIATVNDFGTVDNTKYPTVIVEEKDRGGVFSYDANAGADDGGTVFSKWVRQYDNAIHTSWFDDIQKAFDVGGSIVINKIYHVTKRVTVKDNTNVYMTTGVYIQNTDTTLTQNDTRPATDNGVFEVLNGSKNITFDGLDIRGPWYGQTQPFRDNNIGINISGRFDMENQYSDKYNPGIAAQETFDITIRNCKIEGFAQSGIIADNVTRFIASENTIRNCGRDGIRMYGCEEFDTSDNIIDNMSPGYDGIAPNLNVYGISATSAYKQNPVSRPSRHGVIDSNNITGCKTWKSLDTHGGHDIVFSNNICKDSNIGIGIDKGGYTASGKYNPAKNLVITGNILTNDLGDSDYSRAGITVYANSDDLEEIGKSIMITGNYIRGFGQESRDGAISLSMQEDVNISGNTIVDSIRCAVFIGYTVKAISITGNTIKDISSTGTTREGINQSNWVGDCVADSNVFMVTNGTPFPPTKLYDIADNSFKYGSSNIEIDTLPIPGLLFSDGGKPLDTVAQGQLNSGVFSNGVGVKSSSKLATGSYEIVLTKKYSYLYPVVSAAHATIGLSSTVVSVDHSGTESKFIVNTFKTSDGVQIDATIRFVVTGY